MLLQPKAGSGESKGHEARPAGTEAHTPACSQPPRRGGTLPETPACAKGTPWQDPWGWELLCFLSFKLQYSLKGRGVSVLCCRCLCISWRGLLEREEQGWGITEEWGLCPGKRRWDRQRPVGRVRAGSTFYDESPGLGGTKWVPW